MSQDSNTSYDSISLPKGWILVDESEDPVLDILKNNSNSQPTNKRTIESTSNSPPLPSTEDPKSVTTPPTERLFGALDKNSSKVTKDLTTKKSHRILPTLKYRAPENPSIPAFTVEYCLSLDQIPRFRYSNQLYNQLNWYQREAHDAVIKNSQNIYIAGVEDSGRSTLLKSIICRLYCKSNSKYITLTSFTGTVAKDIEGISLFDIFYIDDPTLPTEYYTSKITQDPLRARIINQTKYLIIDEISIFEIELLEKIESICRKLRCVQTPFGGIQLVFCGELDQWPDNNNRFESVFWKNIIDKTIYLRFKQTKPKYRVIENKKLRL